MNPAVVTIRPGRATDFDRVVDMTREVWGGTDYVPFVWDKWIKQTDGIVLVAETDGQIVGLQNQYLQNADSAWIEGIRVDDKNRGRGIAQKLLRAGIDWARWHECARCRLTTSSENVASKRIAEATGFTLVASFDMLRAETERPGMSTSRTVRLGKPWELDTILSLLSDSRLSRARGFSMKNWTAQEITASYLRAKLGMNSVLVVGEQTALATCVISCHPPFGRLQVEALVGEPEAVASVGSYLREWRGMREVRALTALGDETIDLLLQSGYYRASEFQVNLYQLELDERAAD